MKKFNFLAACAAILCALLFNNSASAQTFSSFPREELEKISFCNGTETATYTPAPANFTFNMEEKTTVYSFMLGRWVASPTPTRANYKFEEKWMVLRVYQDRSVGIAIYTLEYEDRYSNPPMTNIFAEPSFIAAKGTVPVMKYQLPPVDKMGPVVVLNEIPVEGKYNSGEEKGLEVTFRFRK